jgi:hypothetical protein
VKYNFILNIIFKWKIASIGEEVKKLYPSYTADGNAKWYNHFEKLSVHSKLRIELPFYLAIPFLEK